MGKLTIAVIGCGTIAKTQHLKAYTRNPLADVKYVVDIDRERAAAAATEFHVPNVETDFRKVLEDGEVDAVSVCTPNFTHAPIAIACLSAGKHVLCEKPAALNYSEAQEMKAAADRSGKILNIGVVNRFNTAVNQIKRMIDEGELGKVYHVNCSFRSHRSIPGLGGPFTTKAKSGGGVLVDWGVHFLDLIFYCLGASDVVAVSGATHSEMAKDMKEYAYVNMWAGPPDYNGTYDVEDYVTGLIRMKQSTISVNGAWAQNIGENAMHVEFLGDRGGIKLQYGGDFKVYTSKNGVLYETIPTFAKSDMFFEEIDGFLQSVKSGVKNRANIDEAILTTRVMDALYESAAAGGEVKL